jgi:hypothetical protein
MNVFELAEGKGYPQTKFNKLDFLQKNVCYHKLCDLQAWLRTEHQNFSTIIPFVLEDGDLTYEYTNYLLGAFDMVDHDDGPFYSYMEAMEASCIEALNLIK